MFGKDHSAAPHFPCAPIISCQQEFMGALTFGQTACDISNFRFCLSKCKRGSETCKNYEQQELIYLHSHFFSNLIVLPYSDHATAILAPLQLRPDFAFPPA